MKDENLKSFKKTLRRSARLAALTGKISLKDYLKVESVLINSVRKTPDGTEVNLLDEIAQDIVMDLQSDGKVGTTDTVDSVNWDSVLAFVKDLMPTVLSFITSLLEIFDK